MKALKSSLQEMREIFDRSITIRDIAEPFISFDSIQEASQIREYLEQRDFDVVGVREGSIIKGFAKRKDLTNSSIGKHIIQFSEKNVLSDRAPLLQVFKILRQSQQVFVILKDQVWGIVTSGDLQKGPVRMWLFGLISLLEMNFLRMIRNYYPEASWKKLLTTKRIKKAEFIFRIRKQRNEATDLIDCLQFCDKANIILETGELMSALDFGCRKEADEHLRDLENLRNKLAHSQDIITENWPEICDLADAAERILQKCEEYNRLEVTAPIKPFSRQRRIFRTVIEEEAPVSIQQNIKINHSTLKVEKVNAKGMIEGFRKDGGHYYVTIFTASKNSWSLKNNFQQKPKIITTMKGKPKRIYPLSNIGLELNAEQYVHHARYLAVLDRIFHIQNKDQVWEDLCTNGIFDIWDPIAPFNSLVGKPDPMILLLRIFEINHDFSDEIEEGAQSDSVKEQEVTISKPIIPNDDFMDITFKIRSAVENFLVREEPVCDTSMYVKSQVYS